LLWLIDTGEFDNSAPESQNLSFSEPYVAPFTRNTWCFDYFDIPTDLDPLMQDIVQGTIILISDGSYNPTNHRGTAAWLLEGTTSSTQISGRVITPGRDSDISAYRSKLSGILATITVINALAKHHNISTKVMLRCDCEKGLEKAFDTAHPSLKDKSNNLLKAIHHKVNNSNIQWSGEHIRGHQDDTVPFHELDRPSQLNMIVDRMAKEFHSIIADTPRHYDVQSSSWTIRLGNIPLISDIDSEIYDIVHSPTAKKSGSNNQR
jgi:hypothetical protein